MINFVNTIHECFELQPQAINVSWHGDKVVVFSNEGLHMVLTNRFNKLLGAIMTEYAFNSLRDRMANISGPEAMNMAEYAWSFGFGTPVCVDIDRGPCLEIVWEWNRALNGTRQFSTINRAGYAAHIKIQYVVHLERLGDDGDTQEVFFLSTASCLRELDQINETVRAFQRFDAGSDTVVIHPVAMTPFSMDKMIKVS